jgi:23S rRNA-/tRNA-specific pseudouridylate synthase
LIAKTQESFLNLKAQFQDRTVTKTYKAITHGFFKEVHGVINKPIGRSTSDFRKWSAEYGARGELRDAVTEYCVLGQGEIGGVKLSYLDVSPKTGRTHQIRVHLKAIGHPILCDVHYAPKAPRALGFKRFALHASSIVFRRTDGALERVQTNLPEDFLYALAELRFL